MGDSIEVKIAATNAYGTSDFSLLGSGAVLQIVPYAPRFLQNDLSVTSASQLQITWQDGITDGGTPVIDWLVEMEEQPGLWVLLEDSITQRVFTSAFVVEEGETYNLAVTARNLVGYSERSDPIAVLAAQKPDVPTDI